MSIPAVDQRSSSSLRVWLTTKPHHTVRGCIHRRITDRN